MKIPKKSLIAGFAAAGIVGLAVIGSASALTSTNATDSLSSRLANKFGLNQTDVQQVIDGYKSEKETEHEQKFEERLTQAVTDGKITEDQKTKILTKAKEVKTKVDEIRSMTDETARKDAMNSLMDDVKQWAKDNNLPDHLMMMAGRGGPGGHGGMGADGFEGNDGQAPPDSSDSPSSSAAN